MADADHELPLIEAAIEDGQQRLGMFAFAAVDPGVVREQVPVLMVAHAYQAAYLNVEVHAGVERYGDGRGAELTGVCERNRVVDAQPAATVVIAELCFAAEREL